MFSEDNAITPAPIEVLGNNDSVAAIERAQIDTQVATARKYPRSMAQVKSTMLSIATLDEETAAACFYTLPRGGKTIQGPSVRLAEIALSSYGNVKAGTRILSVDTGANPHAVVQAVVHDLERNVAYSVEKRRRIVGKKSKGGRPDEDDINLAVNAGSAIAFRDAVFKVVPGALVKSVFDAAKRVAVGDVKSLAKKREQVVGRLKQMGATEDRIFAVLGVKKIEEVTLEHVETLIGIGTALKDGAVSLEEAFPAVTTTPAPVFAATKTASTRAGGPDDEIPGLEPATAPATEQTPQDKLADLMVAAGIPWEQFGPWAMSCGYCASTAAGFSDLPTRRAATLAANHDATIAKFRAETQQA